MNTAYRLIFIAVFGLFLACQKEVSNGPVTPGPGNNPVTVTASVVGRVINEMGDPVAGATVKAGISSALTDINGEFKLTNAQLTDKAAYVTVNKPGYFEGSRTFVAREGLKHFVEVQLVPKLEVGSINGTTGGTINLGNGSAITLPANGVVVKSSGAAYTGAVKVSMAWIDPTSKDLFRKMPGDLRGTDASNNEVAMESYGMIGVELNSTSGDRLQIATGKKATLKFPLPSSIQGSAPATIALWSFDETTGLWKQEGTATKSGSTYTAEVSHFSWWNCDIPITTAANFTATFVDQNGQPLTGYHVSIYKASNSYSGAHGYTDSAGFIAGRIPANEPLVLKVDGQYPCYSVIYTQNIAPVATNATNNLGTIAVTLNSAFTVTLTGTAENCSAAPVTNGYIEISTGNYGTFRKNISNGSFTLSFPKCSAGDVTYYVVDKATNQQSTPVTINVTGGTTTNLGTLTACGVSTLEYIDFSYDGESFSMSNADSIGAFNSVQSPTLSITGYQVSPTTQTFNNIFLNVNNGGATGTFPLISISGKTNTLSFQYGSAQANAINVVITADGGPGGYIEGNFAGSITDANSVSHQLQCAFRVRRS